MKGDPELLANKRAADRQYAAANAEAAAERMAAWAPLNRDKLNANSARYVDRHPERRTESSRRSYLKKYGLTPERFAEMLINQSGVCAICRTDKPGGKGTWRVDHNHTTGRVRGLLCHGCNVALGHMKDNPETCETAAVYLRKTS